MIMQIEIIGYGVIGLVLTIITMILMLDNIKLNKRCKEEIQRLKELEKEARFKLNLRS